MRLTKMGHACVRLEKDGATLVIDPGGFTEPEAVMGADAVLITHEHPDHLDEDRLRAAVEQNRGLEIWTNPSVTEQLDGIGLGVPIHAVGQDDAFSAAGFDVRVHGEYHAVVHPDFPVVRNVGFLVDGAVFHPGDALTVPGVPVSTLMLPVHAPWMKMSETIDYLREVGPRHAYALHDGMLNDRGLRLIERILGGDPDVADADAGFSRLRPDESVELG